MGLGRSKKKPTAEELRHRASDIKEKAAILAEEGKPALRDFSSTTSAAAREFATTAFSAAKELMEVVEKAADRLEEQSKPARRRGRKLLKASIAIGAGVFLFTNEKVRSTVTGLMGGGSEPEPWAPPSDGQFTPSEPSSTTTP
ncbi:MAG TPA: hypothetical protein VM840_11020 [Actinomycetota bacterium]|nr:hypothetical protein [Actinomycetota bacterium]